MKKIILFGFGAVMCVTGANARDMLTDFSREVDKGVDLVGTREGGVIKTEETTGEMGREVYGVSQDESAGVWDMFVPTSAYVRLGGGMVFDVASSKASVGDAKYKSSDSYTYQFGLGWNMSSYVRSEISFQNIIFGFSHLPDAHATYQQGNLMLYFDLARRYVETGDVTRLRRFVPFIGFGAGMGYYEFEGANGSNGCAFAAPRGEVGFNIMLTDLIGLDFAYQYQMMHNRGFGWNNDGRDKSHISNVVASFRFNF